MHNQGLILKLLIRKHNYTQETFAEKLGVSRGFIQSLTAKNKLTENMIDSAKQQQIFRMDDILV